MKILILDPSNNEAGVFYRLLSPWRQMQRNLSGAEIKIVNEFSWDRSELADIVVCYHFTTEKHLKMLTTAKLNGAKIWLDYDDNLFEVPTDSRGYWAYESSAAKNQLRKCLEIADIVTVSTPELKRIYQPWVKCFIKVVPNALDTTLVSGILANQSYSRTSSEKVVLFRGSDSHNKNLGAVKDIILELMNAHVDWTWVFMGYIHPDILEEAPTARVNFIAATDTLSYYKNIIAFRPNLCFIPQINNSFNRSRSNVGWLEATLAGAAVLAPKHWEVPGILTYENLHLDFWTKLDKCLSMPVEELKQMAKTSALHIEQNFMIDSANKLRVEILEEHK